MERLENVAASWLEKARDSHPKDSDRARDGKGSTYNDDETRLASNIESELIASLDGENGDSGGISVALGLWKQRCLHVFCRIE